MRKVTAGYWDNKENVMKFLREIQEKYNLSTPQDWNALKTTKIQKSGGGTILHKYSIHELKRLGCPEGKFKQSLKYKPIGYWKIEKNITDFLLKVEETLNLKKPEDWNYVTKKQIENLGGSSLLKYYSLYEIKCLASDKSKIEKPFFLSSNFWEKQENIQNFLLQIKEKFHLKTPEDWNLLSQNQIISMHGKGLLKKYSMYDIKCMGCPEGKEQFNPPVKPTGYWDNKENIQNFINILKDKYNLKTKEDWNSITTKHIQSLGGIGLFNHFSLYDIKLMGFPDGSNYFNKPYKNFGFWSKKEKILEFLNEFKVKYNLQTPDDWNSISVQQIKNSGGSILLKKYSMFDIKCIGCPEGKFIYNKYNKYKSFHFWNNKENVRHFIDDFKAKFSLKTDEDWKRISQTQICEHGGAGLLNNFDHIKEYAPELLNIVFLKSSFDNTNRSSQRWLFLQIQKLFPHDEIVEDYFHSELSRKSGFNIQFDIFLIQRNIAFEYHGKQHYEDIPSGFSPLELYKKRDQEKEKLCQEFGIQLIVIPYWWNNKIDSLQETIQSKLQVVAS